MKRVRFFIVAMFLFLISGNVDAANSIDSITMDIYIDPNGTAHVTETWDAYLDQGTEGYKPYYNLENSEIQNFKVYADGTLYTNIGTWNTSASFSSKAYKNGFNYITDGVELCFGISEYGKHEYVMEYEITNFVTGLEDADMVYWTLMPHKFSVEPDDVYIKIYADEAFEDTLDVWGYGNYGGYAYVYDGYIEMSSDGSLDSTEYMTILVKFPKGTFNTSNNQSNETFDYYLDMAEEGAVHYDSGNRFSPVLAIILMLFYQFSFWGLFIFAMIEATKSSKKVGTFNLKFGSTGTKIPKDVPLYRDLPCNKDIFSAYWVAANYNLMKNKTDFLGAVLLKWLKEGHITIKKTESGVFNKEHNAIVLNSNVIFENYLETQLYKMLLDASQDGILEENEFKRWCSRHYNTILRWFDKMIDDQTLKLQKAGMVETTTKKILGIESKVYNVNPRMMEEAIKMKGLKKFLKEFTLIDKREAIEVTMWEEYLMYAQIFGIADKVAEQFKKLYPDIITDYSYDSIIFIHTVSYSGMRSASSARSNAYSFGGGGRSSGGGGGGSRGGGGGGGGFR